MRPMVIAAVLVVVTSCATPQPSGTASTVTSPLTCMPCEAPCVYPCRAVAVAMAAPAPRAPAAVPTFSPEPGSFTGVQYVTLSSSTPDAVIHYTNDGSTPTSSSPVYTGPIAVHRAMTIKAVAIAPGAPASEVMSGAFDVAPMPLTAAVVGTRVVVKKEKLELTEKVYFDTGKATIKPVSYTLLDEVAAALESHDEVKRVRIEGHTDSVGDARLNKKISQQRAEAVREYLQNKGIDASRLEATGHGEEKPVAPNTTAEGREANRRVEFGLEM